MILVLIVISPLINFMKLDMNFEYFLMSNDFAVETSDFKNKLNQMEEKQNDAVFSEYEGKLKKQVAEMLLNDGVHLVSFDLTFDRDVQNMTYGEIMGMGITASLDKGEEERNEIPPLDLIEISKIDIDGQAEKSNEDLPSPMEINIKNKLSDFYNIEPDNINISIQGG
jgi:stage III sporulation protein AF